MSARVAVIGVTLAGALAMAQAPAVPDLMIKGGQVVVDKR